MTDSNDCIRCHKHRTDCVCPPFRARWQDMRNFDPPKKGRGKKAVKKEPHKGAQVLLGQLCPLCKMFLDKCICSEEELVAFWGSPGTLYAPPADEQAPLTGETITKLGRFQEAAREVGDLVEEKNRAYGNSHGDAGRFLEVLYPNGVRPDQYGDMLTVVRIFDKLKRIATNKGAFSEDPWKDICGYGLLGLVKGKEDSEEE